MFRTAFIIYSLIISNCSIITISATFMYSIESDRTGTNRIGESGRTALSDINIVLPQPSIVHHLLSPSPLPTHTEYKSLSTPCLLHKQDSLHSPAPQSSSQCPQTPPLTRPPGVLAPTHHPPRCPTHRQQPSTPPTTQGARNPSRASRCGPS